jgi:hypothetical protein
MMRLGLDPPARHNGAVRGATGCGADLCAQSSFASRVFLLFSRTIQATSRSSQPSSARKEGKPVAQGSGHSDGCEVAVKRLTCMNTVDTAWFTIHSLL